jgi:hypothetical protein
MKDHAPIPSRQLSQRGSDWTFSGYMKLPIRHPQDAPCSYELFEALASFVRTGEDHPFLATAAAALL